MIAPIKEESLDKTEEKIKILPKEFLDLPAGKASLPKESLELRSPPRQTASDAVKTWLSQTPPQNDVKTLLSWTAPGRPFRKRGKQYYLTSLLIMLLIEIILFLFSQYILMLLVVSLVFVAFTLSLVAPKDFHYRISTEGITIEEHFFLWQELYDFYFKKQHNIDVLHIRTHSLLPGELTITLGDIHKDHIKSALLPFLPFREIIKKTFMENSGDWLARNFPLDKPDVSKAK